MQYMFGRKRRAIAMIELIFAIVVMGIALMSLPTIVRLSTQNTYTGLQQESVAIVASHIQTLMGMEWDNEDNATNHYPVLQTDSTAIPSCVNAYPPGTSDNDGRYCLYDSSSSFLHASVIGPDADDLYGFDDIDDYDGNVTHLTLYGYESATPCQGNYIDLNVSIATTVKYADDAPRNSSGAAGSLGQTTTYSNVFNYTKANNDTHNIKLISVHLTTANPASDINKSIRLSAFMCNIGAPRQIYSKEY